VHEIALRIGPLTIYWYGVFVAAGFLVGIWSASRRALSVGIAPDTIVDLGPWLVVGAILGARMLYVVSYWREQYAQGPFYEVFMIHHGGLVYHGGLAGAFIGGVWFVHRRKLPFWLTADIMAPSIALGHAFGRIGCYMKGCCYGQPTSSLWAIHFPSDHETHGVGVHPTEIYEAALNLLLSFGLAWKFRHKRFQGQIFGLYLVCYAVVRSCVDIFRGDYPIRYFGWMTPGQSVSLLVLAGGLVVLARGWMVQRHTAGPAA
jgi:phosphatidylglycerol---prolipoprotein diacylglyceryl transferase